MKNANCIASNVVLATALESYPIIWHENHLKFVEDYLYLDED